VQNLFLYTRFFFYLLLIVALVFKSFKGHLREEIFILLTALFALVTDILDQVVFTSNLELYAVFNVIATFFVLGLCHYIIKLKKWLTFSTILIGLYTLFIFLSDYSLFNVSTLDQMYSDYGFLNAGEIYNLRLLSSFVILPCLFYSLYYKIMYSESTRTSFRIYLALFGFITLYSVPFLWYLLGRALIGTDSLKTVIPTSFVVSYSLLSASVLWKK
jgi:hypothetical protein